MDIETIVNSFINGQKLQCVDQAIAYNKEHDTFSHDLYMADIDQRLKMDIMFLIIARTL